MSREQDERNILLRDALNLYQAYVAKWAEDKGFWLFNVKLEESDEALLAMRIEHELVKSTKLMLMVSELGECLEAIRKGDTANEVEELADCVIRILDYSGTYELALGEAIIKKMAVNEGRPHKHGKAF